MEKFIEFVIDGKTHIVNVSNIAMLKQIDSATTEIHLLSKVNGEQIMFKVAYNLGHFQYILRTENAFALNAPLYDTK